MPVDQPWSLDVDTIVGVAVTLLALLAAQVAARRRERRQSSPALAEPVAAERHRRPGAGGTECGRSWQGAVAAHRLQNGCVVVPYRVAQVGPGRGAGVKSVRLKALQVFALLVAGILAVGCRSPASGDGDLISVGRDEVPPAQPAPLVPVVFGATDRPTDQFELNTAAVAGAVLTIKVSYGGGCRAHEFVLTVADAFPADAPPDELEMALTHEDNDDPCEAYPSEQLRFDLTPIRDRYRDSYGQDSGSVRLRLDRAPSTGGALVYRF